MSEAGPDTLGVLDWKTLMEVEKPWPGALGNVWWLLSLDQCAQCAPNVDCCSTTGKTVRINSFPHPYERWVTPQDRTTTSALIIRNPKSNFKFPQIFQKRKSDRSIYKEFKASF